MAQLIFKRGSLANLNNLAIKDGQFIVTTDEGALYIDNGSTRVRLGDFIIVENVAALPSAGANRKAMYYCESENVLARWNGTDWVQINKQPTTAELKVKLGLDAEGEVTAAIAAAKKAGDDAQEDVNALTDYVGTFTHDTAKTVVEYINAKTDGIATSGNLEALGQRVTTVEGKVATIEGDYLKGADKTELEGKITAAQNAADKAQGDVDTLTQTHATDKKALEDAIALKGDATAVEAAQSKADSAYELAESKATMDEVNEAIANAGHAVASEVESAIAEIDEKIGEVSEGKTVVDMIADAQAAATEEDEKLAGLISDNSDAIQAIADDYLKASDKTELEGAIDAKADQTALDAEIERATGVEGGFETRIKAIEDDYLKAADKTELQDNIDTLTGVVEALRDGVDAEKVDGVIDLINYVEEHGAEVTGMKEDIADNAKAIEDEAARADGAEKALGGRIDELSGVVDDKAAASDLTALDGRVQVVEGKVATLEGEMDAVEKKADDNAAAIEALQTASATHATKDELQAVSDVAEAAVTVEEMNAAISAAGHASQANLDSHVNNADIHVTTADKEKWNGAVTDLAAHKSAYDAKVAELVAEDADIRVDFAAADAALKTELQGYADQAELDAIAAAKLETESQVGALKTEMQGKVDTVSGALDTYKTENNAAVALKADASAVYTKAEVEAMLTWAEF